MLGCDLGSNTLRVVLFDCKTKERVKEFEKIVRTAQGIKNGKKISKSALNRVIDAILQAKKEFEKDCKSKHYKAVATAALRMAENSSYVIESIYKKTGILFEIIDPLKEAQYTALAVENRLKKLKLNDKSYILLDLGGGSCEIVVKNENTVISESFDLGIVTIVEKYSLKELDRAIKKECRDIALFAKKIDKKPDIFIGSSGTPTTIASFLNKIDYANYDYTKINGFILSSNDLQNALEKLILMSEEERKKWVGVGRDDLILAGIKILSEILLIFNYDEMMVIDDGLREGVALANCNKQNFNKN